MTILRNYYATSVDNRNFWWYFRYLLIYSICLQLFRILQWPSNWNTT